jgi:hypothetical protein
MVLQAVDALSDDEMQNPKKRTSHPRSLKSRPRPKQSLPLRARASLPKGPRKMKLHMKLNRKMMKRRRRR